MPNLIPQLLKRFLLRLRPIQEQLDKVEFSIEVKRLMQELASIPAEELKTRLASSGVTLQSIQQTAEEFLANLNMLLEAERVRHELQKISLNEIRKLNEALVDAQKKWGSIH